MQEKLQLEQQINQNRIYYTINASQTMGETAVCGSVHNPNPNRWQESEKLTLTLTLTRKL